MGGSKGKGKHKSKRSEEEVLHAREVNRQREEAALPKKSPGSVSRAKARSAASHAAKSAPIAADTIAEPKVKPPPPPPPPSRKREGGNVATASGEGIRLVPRGEPLPHDTEQRERSPRHSKPKARGELLPPERSTRQANELVQGRNKQQGHKRGENLPQQESQSSKESSSQQRQLLPQDAVELDTDSRGESNLQQGCSSPAGAQSQTSHQSPRRPIFRTSCLPPWVGHLPRGAQGRSSFHPARVGFGMGQWTPWHSADLYRQGQ